jgi:hypothetical protein
MENAFKKERFQGVYVQDSNYNMGGEQYKAGLVKKRQALTKTNPSASPLN